MTPSGTATPQRALTIGQARELADRFVHDHPDEFPLRFLRAEEKNGLYCIRYTRVFPPEHAERPSWLVVIVTKDGRVRWGFNL